MKEFKSSKVVKFSFRIEVRKQKCVLERNLDKKGRMPFVFVFFSILKLSVSVAVVVFKKIES